MRVSKLKTEVVLSTLHAEYVDLSRSMRYFLPLKTLLMDVIKVLGLDPDKLKYNTNSKVFEENPGALQLAKCSSITPGSKCFAVKYHWFREKINNGECTVEIFLGVSSIRINLQKVFKEKSSFKLGSYYVAGRDNFL